MKTRIKWISFQLFRSPLYTWKRGMCSGVKRASFLTRNVHTIQQIETFESQYLTPFLLTYHFAKTEVMVLISQTDFPPQMKCKEFWNLRSRRLFHKAFLAWENSRYFPFKRPLWKLSSYNINAQIEWWIIKPLSILQSIKSSIYLKMCRLFWKYSIFSSKMSIVIAFILAKFLKAINLQPVFYNLITCSFILFVTTIQK